MAWSQVEQPGRRRRGVLVPVILAALVSPAAASGTRVCTRSCKVPVTACMRCVRTDVRTARAACAGPRGARRQCRSEAVADGKAAMTRCRTLAASCVACCGAGGASCSTTVEPICPIGRHVDFTPPPRRDPATLPLPPAADGKLVVLELPGGRLDVDPAQRGPLTVLGRCTAWIAGCVAPPARTLDDCARSAPTCSGTAPWEEPQPCCPAACFAAYRRARVAAPTDEAPLDTFTRVYFDDAACFPGVRAAVGR
jgi:hypothetical protein